MQDFCKTFAKKGYVTASVNYRLVSLANIVSFLSNHDEQYEEVLKATSDIKAAIEEIPEFRNSATRVQIQHGDSFNKVSKYALVVAAGTNGGYHIAKAYFEHGISTVIFLHVNGEDLARLKENKVNGNLVILGHLAGDSVGLNLFADVLEKEGIEVVKLGILGRD